MASDYTTLLKGLTTGPGPIEDIYQQVMGLENERLKVLDKLIDQKNNIIWANSIFLNKSILEILKEFTVAWTYIFDEIVVKRNVKTYDDVMRILYEDDRKIYVGLMLIFVAIFMFFIHVSN